MAVYKSLTKVSEQFLADFRETLENSLPEDTTAKVTTSYDMTTGKYKVKVEFVINKDLLIQNTMQLAQWEMAGTSYHRPTQFHDELVCNVTLQ